MFFVDFFKQLNISPKNVNSNLLNQEISLLCQNNQEIKENAVFFAKEGASFNGANFIQNTNNFNYVAFVSSNNSKAKELSGYQNVVFVENLENTMQQAVDILYNLRPKNTFAVTGTNGKSSVVCFIRQILTLLNVSSSSVGTLGFYINDTHVAETLTTPSSLELARYAHLSKKQGIDYLALEGSSHGMVQGRMQNTPANITAFLNLTQDHLDYHNNLESYFKAKQLLFTKYSKTPKKIAINIDDEYGLKLFNSLDLNNKDHVITFGFNKQSDFLIKEIKTHGFYQHVFVSYLGKDCNFKINMLGDFQVYNIVCASLMVLLTKDFGIEQIIETLNKVHAEKGRLELIAEHKNALIYVDYAHTPSALEAVLLSLKKGVKGNVHVVFGCGGNRDSLKRPLMGKTAYLLANYVYVTDDNPRHENPSNIRKEVLNFEDGLNITELNGNSDFKNPALHQNNIYNIEGRELAIEFAISKLKKDDVLLIAGKGHEQYQIIKDTKHNFSDYDVVKNKVNKSK